MNDWERAAARLLPEAVEVVGAELGEPVPPVRVICGTRREIADLCVAASGYQAGAKDEARYFRRIYREIRDAWAVAIPCEPAVIALHASRMATAPGGLLPTLIHELVHVVQFSRPGWRERWLAGERHNLRVARLPVRQLRVWKLAKAAAEREAYLTEFTISARTRQAV
jgi:hypothetical protein